MSDVKTKLVPVGSFDEATKERLPVLFNQEEYLPKTKEEFWLMYSSMILILKGSSDVKMKLFAGLLERYARGTEFSMSKGLKDVIAKETDCSPRSFDSAFSELIKHNIIVKVGANLYRINPRHVFQGNSNERHEQLQAVILLHCREC